MQALKESSAVSPHASRLRQLESFTLQPPATRGFQTRRRYGARRLRSQGPGRRDLEVQACVGLRHNFQKIDEELGFDTPEDRADACRDVWWSTVNPDIEDEQSWWNTPNLGLQNWRRSRASEIASPWHFAFVIRMAHGDPTGAQHDDRKPVAARVLLDGADKQNRTCRTCIT